MTHALSATPSRKESTKFDTIKWLAILRFALLFAKTNENKFVRTKMRLEEGTMIGLRKEIRHFILQVTCSRFAD